MVDPMPLFHNRQILLGVTGSIAAYKAADLASKLTQAGALVDTVLTQSALQFVTPLTFQSVTSRRAYLDADLWGLEGHIHHISLGKAAELVVVAPATANTIAKLAHGIADNLLCVTALAATCPIIIAPAMDGGMYLHPATQANLEILRQRNVVFVGPAEGHLASGMSGIGRMVEPNDLFGHIRLTLARNGSLKGKTVIVTAGGTQEPIDPVRVIANRSSGKQGYALAQAALDRGARVTLISAPTTLPTPVGAERVDIQSAEEMHAAVMTVLPKADVLIMAAAVADFQPQTQASQKIKREKAVPQIELVSTPDILKAVMDYRKKIGRPPVIVGFAAESHNVIQNARHKLLVKGVDLIVANDISLPNTGFGFDTNQVAILDAGGGEETLPLMSKSEVAETILERVTSLLG